MRNYILIVLLLILLLAGCRNRAEIVAQVGQPQAEIPAALLEQMPGLPPSDATHSTSVVINHVVQGSIFYDKSSNTNVNPPQMELSAGLGELSFAVYSFDLGGYQPTGLSMNASFMPESSWFVFADYATNAWQFVHATDTTVNDIAIPPDMLNSESGIFYCGLITYDNASAVIQSVALSVETPEWDIHMIEVGSNIRSMDACLVNDRLYVAYTNDAQQIRLARATAETPSATAHWDISTTYDNVDVYHINIAEVNALPALLWFREPNFDQWYQRSTTLTPADSGDWVFNNLEDSPGSRPQLAVIGGRPASAYINKNAQFKDVIRFAQSQEVEPDSVLDWIATDAVSTNLSQPQLFELREHDGGPAVFCFDMATQDLICSYAAANPTGTDDWTVAPVSSGALLDMNARSAMGVLDGRISLLYTLAGSTLSNSLATSSAPSGLADWETIDLGALPFGLATLDPGASDALGCYLTSGSFTMTALLGNTAAPRFRRDWRKAPVFNGTGFGNHQGLILSTADGTPVVVFTDDIAQAISLAVLRP